MRTLRPTLLLVSLATTLFPFASHAALAGAVKSIEMHDWNRNGKIDRAVIAVENPGHTSWSVRNSAGLAITLKDAGLKISSVFIASTSTADPLLIEAVLDETDTDLLKTTSTADFEVTYVPTSDLSGISDGTNELQRIDKGDGLLANSEQDKAAPLLVSATPVPGGLRIGRSTPIVLTFSEPMSETSFTFDSGVKPGDWLIAWSSDSTRVTLQHTPYKAGVTETFSVAAQDKNGNQLAASSFPNPFSFRITNDDDHSPQADFQFLLTTPVSAATLTAGTPTVVAWYSNQSEATRVDLSYSADGGSSYVKIGSYAATDTAVWFVPAVSGQVLLKAESFTSAGIPVNLAVQNVSIAIPAEKPVLRAVIAPTVSETTDTSAKIALATDAPPKTTVLSCGSSPIGNAAMQTVAGRPTMINFSLTGLQKGANYACTVVLTDAFGATVEAAVPVFTASVAGDTTAPKLLEAKVDEFNVALKTARLTWRTDEPTTYDVSYGKLLDYGGKLEGRVLNATHSVTLVNLEPGAMHQARITMTDAKGNAAVSADIQFVFMAEGTLVKGSTSSVYWYVDGKRFVFPHENIYKSWFKDFSKVVTIPDGQLASLALGGNVQMRAGTNLLKIQSDPKVYAVENGGMLRPIASEAQAIRLYGADWAKRVRDIDVGFFTGYRIGVELAGGEWPAIYLARTASNGKVWLVTGNSIRSEVTPDAMTRNGIDASYAVTVDENSVDWDRLSVGSAVQGSDTRFHVIWGNDKGETAVSP